MKQRAFESEESELEVARTEPTPHGRTSIALVLASWVLPIWMIVSLFRYAEAEPGMRLVHRIVTITSVALLLGGMGLAIRAIDRARKDRRIRRRLAIAALLLSLLTPVVWGSELTFAWQVFVTRTRLEAEAADASSPASE